MKINKTFSFLIRINIIYYIVIWLFIFISVNLLALLFPESSMDNHTVNELPQFIKPFIIIFFGPLFETLIFQALIISSICFFVEKPRKNFYISIIASTLIFAFVHFYSVFYFIMGLLVGFVLAVSYYFARYRKENAIIPIFLIHAIWNCMVFISEKYFST